MEYKSAYKCDCGNVFDLKFVREYGFDIYYRGRCSKCNREVFEWKKNPNAKNKEVGNA